MSNVANSRPPPGRPETNRPKSGDLVSDVVGKTDTLTVDRSKTWTTLIKLWVSWWIFSAKGTW